MAPRTIVVGAGVLGLSTAERLAAAGHEVRIVERAEPGSGTSRTSFAWLNSNSKVPASYQRLNVAGAERYRELVGVPGTASWLRLDGRLQWAVEPDDVDELERVVAAMRGQDYPVESITPEGARRLEPDVIVPDGAEVRLWPSEGFVIPPLFLEWLLARARSRGVEVVTNREVVGFAVERGAVLGVRLADGSTLRADRVVTCVGRWTEDLFDGVGVHIPMQPLVQGSPAMGLLGYSTSVPTRLRRTISTPTLSVRADSPAGRYVLQRHGLDHLAVPGSVPDPAGEVGQEILERARAVLAGFDGARLAELRVGYRSVPADRVTVAGWAPGVDGLYVLATHSGYTLALHLGELVAREVAAGRDEPALAEFRPSRFSTDVDLAAVAARPVH